jgi:hypothetical protein
VLGAPVIAFLNTGRCGTQWLADGLRRLHPELDAEHEPLGPLYKPRRYFRRYEDPDALLEVDEVTEHMARIERGTRPYAETGWPLFPALPLLARRLGNRLRVVHLTRHPVPSALSHLAHNSYAGSPRDDAYTRWATLGPEDPRVFGREYAERWAELSAYEKCLFWWTEVHQFALELPGRIPEVPVHRVQAERLLAGERPAVEGLLDFMGLRWHEGWLAHADRMVDRWHHHTADDVDPLTIHRHPRTLAIAAELGYDLDSLDLAALEARYRGDPDPGLDRIGRFESASSG